MKKSLKTGIGFGLTSGIITTLGLIIGLNAGTHSKIVVIGGILVIAIADAMSDAFGIHISEELSNRNTKKHVWEATFSTFFFKLIFALTFVIPVLLFSLSTAIIVSIIWGLLLLSVFSYFIAKQRNESPWVQIVEHIAIAVLVIIITHLVGSWVATFA